MKTGLESLDTGAPKITYSSNEGPKSPKEIQMAMADPLLEEEYEKYVFEMEEQGLQPMSFEEFERQARSGMKEGGIMGSNAGSMLVAPTADGSRPGYYGPDAGEGGKESSFGKEAYSGGMSNIDRGGKSGGTDAQFQRARQTLNTSAQEQKIANQRAAIEAAKKAEQERIQALLESYRGKTPEAYASTKFGKAIKPYDFSKPPQTFFGIIPTAVHIAKKIKTNLKDKELRKKYGLGPVEDIEIDMPYVPFFKSRIKPESDRDGPPPIIPFIPPIPTTTGLDTTDADADATTTASTFTPATDFNEYDVDQANRDVMVSLGVDPTMFAADGGRIGYAGGGITDLRQGYFLGKLVKKATRAVKKIVKSPIGKAAILAGGAGLLGGAGKFFGTGFNPLKTMTKIGPMSSPFGKLLSKAGMADFVTGDLTKRGIFSGIAALSSLPLFMGQQDEEENLDTRVASRVNDFNPFDQYGGVVGLRRKALAGNLDPAEFAFMKPEFYAANGGLAENRMAALNELYGVNDEEQKLSMGGSAGLPPITMASEGVDTGSFPDDESTGIAQATPTMPNQMPMRQPMMNPMMGRMNPMMARGMMNPMMGRGMPMMGRGMPMMGGRMMAQEGGLMDMGGMEKDYRNEGGFVPIGGQERADDVPARLSKNEFVFTADAVRNAGGGDIDKGAEVMENMMENLEAGGKVSEASQGLKGAREMFATQQRLGEVL